MPNSLTQRSSSLIDEVGASPCVCGSWQTPMKFFGNSVQTRWMRSLQICVHSWLTRKIADVVAHARGARGEDREVGAALALELELRALDRRPDLVVGHLQRRPRRHRRLALDRLGLILAEAVQILGLGRVVAVAIDDHDAVHLRLVAGWLLAIVSLPGLTRQSIIFQRRWMRGSSPRMTAEVVAPPLPVRRGISMADLPRLNNVIRALEEGKHAFTCFSPAEIDNALALSTVEIRRLRLRDGAQSLGRPRAARLPAIHAQPRPDRQGRARWRRR